MRCPTSGAHNDVLRLYGMAVTPDLKETLIHFHHQRKRLGISRLWIDALCINQDDDAEKMLQIHRMRNVYRNATRTLIWLGMSDNDGEELFKAIRDAVQQISQERADQDIHQDYAGNPDRQVVCLQPSCSDVPPCMV